MGAMQVAVVLSVRLQVADKKKSVIWRICSHIPMTYMQDHCCSVSLCCNDLDINRVIDYDNNDTGTMRYRN